MVCQLPNSQLSSRRYTKCGNLLTQTRVKALIPLMPNLTDQTSFPAEHQAMNLIFDQTLLAFPKLIQKTTFAAFPTGRWPRMQIAPVDGLKSSLRCLDFFRCIIQNWRPRT